ncbi:MAG: hypothetical protein KH452_05965 [Clostridiales bacterium]|nr:hypothetical protein [Clostridiales bacterium]
MRTCYGTNATMQMLGKNVYIGPLNMQTFSEIDDILEARPYSCSRDTAMDIFMLGYIHGKRADRERRKRKYIA